MDWEATGLLAGAADLQRRLSLLNRLQGLGFDIELMQTAHEQGRLYALAGDQSIRPGLAVLTHADLAERLQLDVDWVRQLWRALGLTDQAGPVATIAEAEGLAVWATLRALLGDEQALALARVHGAAVARIAEAIAATMVTIVPDIDLAHSGDELATSEAFAAATALLPAGLLCVDALYRHHLQSATRHFEATQVTEPFGPRGAPYCVAFVDLCGFTAATELLSAPELSKLLEVFESTSYDEAALAGGRCVKLIGDAAMFVAASADVLADLVHRVFDRMAGASDVLPVRAGMATGDVVIRAGDYFGQPVNLAARLLAEATPGTLLADSRLVARLDSNRWQVRALPPASVKGVQAPVVPYDVRRRV